MSATKRVAEMLVRERAARAATSEVRMCPFWKCCRVAVAVSIFLRQIAEGKPVTVPDRRMSRYFMTIAESVALVVQASTVVSHGEIYMLDMGNPVMITSLACKLVEMSGLRPDHNVPIHTIGIRPGEKLHEQLWYEGANVSETEFPRVYSVAEETAPPDLGERIEEHEQLARARRSAEVIAALEALPISYKRIAQETSSIHYGQNHARSASL